MILTFKATAKVIVAEDESQDPPIRYVSTSGDQWWKVRSGSSGSLYRLLADVPDDIVRHLTAAHAKWRTADLYFNDISVVELPRNRHPAHPFWGRVMKILTEFGISRTQRIQIANRILDNVPHEQ